MGSGLKQAWVQVPPQPLADCVTMGQSQSLLGFPIGGRALGVAGVGGIFIGVTGVVILRLGMIGAPEILELR